MMQFTENDSIRHARNQQRELVSSMEISSCNQRSQERLNRDTWGQGTGTWSFAANYAEHIGQGLRFSSVIFMRETIQAKLLKQYNKKLKLLEYYQLMQSAK